VKIWPNKTKKPPKNVALLAFPKQHRQLIGRRTITGTLHFKMQKRKPIRPRTSKRAAEEARYRLRVKVWLLLKGCEAHSKIYKGMAEEHKFIPATECHHRFGRRGGLLKFEPFWMAVCSSCHAWIHGTPAKARELGLLAPVGQFNNQSLVPK
jgi:hypothetical protein